MARYFFNLHNDVVTDDTERREFPDREAATAYAMEAVRCIASETAKEGHVSVDDHVDILDENRQLIGSVRVSDVVEIRSK